MTYDDFFKAIETLGFRCRNVRNNGNIYQYFVYEKYNLLFTYVDYNINDDNDYLYQLSYLDQEDSQYIFASNSIDEHSRQLMYNKIVAQIRKTKIANILEDKPINTEDYSRYNKIIADIRNINLDEQNDI